MTVIVTLADTWKYQFVDNTEFGVLQSAGVFDYNYNDSAWPTAQAPFSTGHYTSPAGNTAWANTTVDPLLIFRKTVTVPAGTSTLYARGFVDESASVRMDYNHPSLINGFGIVNTILNSNFTPHDGYPDEPVSTWVGFGTSTVLNFADVDDEPYWYTAGSHVISGWARPLPDGGGGFSNIAVFDLTIQTTPFDGLVGWQVGAIAW